MDDLISGQQDPAPDPAEAHRKEYITRQQAMESITQEYNRRRTGDGLKLAWIEKAIDDVPAAPVLTGEAKRAVLAWMLTYQLELTDLKCRYAASTVAGWMINDFTKEFSDDEK